MTTEEWSDEILALQSIYEEIDVLSDKCIEINFKVCFIYNQYEHPLQGEESSLEASLRVEIAADYPLHCPAVSVQAFFLQREEKSALIKELEDMFSSGEPIVFEWAEKVRGKRSTRHNLFKFQPLDNKMTLKLRKVFFNHNEK